MRFEYLFKGVCCAVRLERSAFMLRWTQLGANNEVATPVNWKNGEGVIIAVASATRTSSSISAGRKASTPYTQIVSQSEVSIRGGSW